MRLRLDGQRLTPAQTEALLAETGLCDLSDRHAQDGFRLNPVRAPRRMDNGSVSFCLSWSRREGVIRGTLRLRIVMDALPV